MKNISSPGVSILEADGSCGLSGEENSADVLTSSAEDDLSIISSLSAVFKRDLLKDFECSSSSFTEGISFTTAATSTAVPIILFMEFFGWFFSVASSAFPSR